MPFVGQSLSLPLSPSLVASYLSLTITCTVLFPLQSSSCWFTPLNSAAANTIQVPLTRYP